MKATLSSGVLVLNNAWEPINVTVVRSAIGLVVTDKARVVVHEDILDKFKGDVICPKYSALGYMDWVRVSELVSEEKHDILHSARCKHFKPFIIVQNTDHFPDYYIKLSRRALYDRDEGRCQYCGEVVERREATVDHLIPKCKKGRNQWNNVVIACKPCNSKKGNKSLRASGMKLIRKPVKPTTYNFQYVYKKEYVYWQDFIRNKNQPI